MQEIPIVPTETPDKYWLAEVHLKKASGHVYRLYFPRRKFSLNPGERRVLIYRYSPHSIES